MFLPRSLWHVPSFPPPLYPSNVNPALAYVFISPSLSAFSLLPDVHLSPENIRTNPFAELVD